jgi:hypothetical protein
MSSAFEAGVAAGGVAGGRFWGCGASGSELELADEDCAGDACWNENRKTAARISGKEGLFGVTSIEEV